MLSLTVIPVFRPAAYRMLFSFYQHRIACCYQLRASVMAWKGHYAIKAFLKIRYRY